MRNGDSGFRRTILDLQVRMSCCLFLDGITGHAATGSRTANRIPVWEIHASYQFEVCENNVLVRPKVGDNSTWMPLDYRHNNADEGCGQTRDIATQI